MAYLKLSLLLVCLCASAAYAAEENNADEAQGSWLGTMKNAAVAAGGKAAGLAGNALNFGREKVSGLKKKLPHDGVEAYTKRVLSMIQKGKMKVCEHVGDVSKLQHKAQQVYEQADLAAVQAAIADGVKSAALRFGNAKTKAGEELAHAKDIATELAGKVPAAKLEEFIIDGPKAIGKLGSDLFVRINLPDGKAVFERLKVSEWKKFVDSRLHDIQSGKVELYVKKPAQEVMQRSAAVAHKVYAQISNKETKEFLESKVHQFQEVVKQAYAAVPDSVKKNVANVFGKIHGIANSAYNRMPAVPEPVRHTAGELYNKAANKLHKHLPHSETAHTATEAEGA